ncbi:MAG: CoA pyrophosphatase [Bacteroidetes bacterium]|nr:CoA pyrophosphatase [Bacteroidota bacterium]
MIDQFSFSEFRDLLITRMSQPLPGQVAQFQMAPLARKQPEMASVESKQCWEAAVLALFYPCSKGRAKLLLTVRPEGMTKHAGQVAFPGGRREIGEELHDTAVRETEEEVFIPASSIDVIGALTPLYIPPSNFCVYPFVGLVNTRPDMSKTSEEVAAMFGVRAHELILPEKREVFVRELAGEQRQIPFFAFSGYQIWGATAMIMSELAAVLNPRWMELDPLV